MTITTPEDAIKAASSIARDVADGRLTPADMEAQLQTELRALVGTVVGEGDPLFDLQVEIARGVLAVGGIPVDELAEWLAVARHRAGEPVSVPEPDDAPPEPVSLPTVALSPESVDVEAITETPADAEPAPVVTPPRQADGYDPLAGWQPGGARRR
ncbi:flagellar hook-length control protein [Mycobacterium adipatum]|uniref:Flagellar hook-length control protein n=1 Tax=Mycobacterium adipatum TaxID=1682113 RepID=A0A172ULR5_9MYCO|nr:flagellar hook-length control protein [Mycobacterium adipatum]ANE80147.1 flagellar hook-length control protein [Mycobacterium adipatum]